MSSKNCLSVVVKETEYVSTIANEYVVLSFFLCFILAAICIIIFVKYVMKLLSLERERERQSAQRRTMRCKAAGSMADLSRSNSLETLPLQTNYLPVSNEEIEDTDGMVERSHLGINIIIEDNHQQGSNALEPCVLEILGTLFTSGRNALPPTQIHQCLSFMLFSFELFLSFHRETFSMLLHMMLCLLFEEKKINEVQKLQLVTRYEQILDEPTKTADLIGYTNKLHFVLAKLEKEISDMVTYGEKQTKTFTGERLCKYLMVVQREMLAHDYNETVSEMFTVSEKGLVQGVMNKWFSLEIARYRINVIYDAMEELLKKKVDKPEVIQTILNGYIANVYEKLECFCVDYEKETFEVVSQLRKDMEKNAKQAFMELEVGRFEQRSDAMQNFEGSKTKAISKFVISHIDTVLSDFKTFTNYKIIVHSESWELFADFQKSKEKQITKLLKQCEEELFENLQNDGVLGEENLIELGKTLSRSLKDFKLAQERVRRDTTDEIDRNITTVAKKVQSTYIMLEKKFVNGIEEIKKQSLEALHSLSNLTEEEMDKLEHEFEVAFSSLAFNLRFVVMSGIISKVHGAMSLVVHESNTKDLSFSLHDMVQILKQDKNVIKRPSLYQKLDPGFYITMETELCKAYNSMTAEVDEHLETVVKTANKVILPKINNLLQDTFLRQANRYFINLCVAKEKLLSCSMDSKGYTSKQASTLARNCFDRVHTIWESQANFKAHKFKEEKKALMADFEPDFQNLFGHDSERNNGQHLEPSFKEFEKSIEQEMKFLQTLERRLRKFAVERVLDCNLENDLMIVKFEEKLETLDSKPHIGIEEKKNYKQRPVRSRKSTLVDTEKGKELSPRRESLRQSISRKKTSKR